jgi:hypothetical protein
LANDLEGIANAVPTDAIGFLARVGTGKVPLSRSIRHDLAQLMV